MKKIVNNSKTAKAKEIIKKTVADSFDIEKKYKLYRTLYEVIHPTISKKNISDYEIVLDNNLVGIRVFYPKGEVKFNKMIIYIHGGGFASGSVNSYSYICKKIANNTKTMVFAINYRLAPEFKFPIGLEDCYNVIKNIYNNKDFNNRDITIMGDSAGANFAISIALLARTRKEFTISREILLYPAISGDYSSKSKYKSVIENSKNDFLTSKHLEEFFNLYINKKSDLKNPLVCPLNEKDFSNMPKSLIMTGDIDPLRDEGYEYYKLLNNNSTYYNVSMMGHGFMSSSDAEVNDEVFKAINTFLGEEYE